MFRGVAWFSEGEMFTAAPKKRGARNDRVFILNVGGGWREVRSEYNIRGTPSHSAQCMVGWCISLQGRTHSSSFPELYRERMIADCYYPQINFAAGGRKFDS